jgi:DNA-directed RNA polymerase specialized sigma24 family protein
LADSQQVHEFYAQWFPTIRSFATLYLGDEDEGTAAAVQAFSKYSRTGLPFETEELPLVLWECAAESVQDRASIADVSGKRLEFDRRKTKFDQALMLLSQEERLAFLLHTVYGLPTAWIMLITGWSAQTIEDLWKAASAKLRKSLRQSSAERAHPTTKV